LHKRSDLTTADGAGEVGEVLQGAHDPEELSSLAIVRSRCSSRSVTAASVTSASSSSARSALKSCQVVLGGFLDALDQRVQPRLVERGDARAGRLGRRQFSGACNGLEPTDVSLKRVIGAVAVAAADMGEALVESGESGHMTQLTRDSAMSNTLSRLITAYCSRSDPSHLEFPARPSRSATWDGRTRSAR